MHLRAHKYLLITLLLFGLGFLVGTTLDMAYRRYTRERAALQLQEILKAPPVDLGAENFPREVAGLKRTELLAGERAKDFVCGYLGTNSDIKEAYIATFNGVRGEAVIFVADFNRPAEAHEVRKDMDSTLKESQAFTDYSIIHIHDDIPITQLQDEKNYHYFFDKGYRMLWLMVKSEEPLQILLDVYTSF